MSSAPSLQVFLDDVDVTRMLHTYEDRGKRPPVRRIGVVMQAMISRNFQEGGRPQRWAPLSENTKAARKRGGGVPLQDTGALKKSVNIQISPPDQVSARSDHEVAAYQHYGTRPHIIRPNPRVTYRTAAGFRSRTKPYEHPGMPARPFMVWQEDGIATIQKLLLDDLLGGGGR